jgi:hypothetical protein
MLLSRASHTDGPDGNCRMIQGCQQWSTIELLSLWSA